MYMRMYIHTDVGSLSLADIRTASLTVIVAKITSSWNTNTDNFLIKSESTDAPFTRICPDNFPPAASPATAFSSVVLPAPDMQCSKHQQKCVCVCVFLDVSVSMYLPDRIQQCCLAHA